MGKYILKRLVSTVITVLAIITITFFLMRMIPGGPFDDMSPDMPQESLDAINERYHLNDPLIMQYFTYLGGVVKGDLGPSYRLPGVTVNDIIAQGFPVSAKVGLAAIGVILVFGITLGIASALRQGRPEEYLITFLLHWGFRFQDLWWRHLFFMCSASFWAYYPAMVCIHGSIT